MRPVTIPADGFRPDEAFATAACPADSGFDLASLVAARLCHDLVSPLGAIGNGVELLEMAGEYPGLAKSPELSLIGESVKAARARVRFYRAAFGHSPPDQRTAVTEIAQLAQDYTRGSRLAVEFEVGGDASRVEARMLLLALMCMDSAMPWGGRVLICRSMTGWRVVGEASRTRSQPGLWGWLGNATTPDAVPDAPPQPSEVHFALLGALARQHRRPMLWEVDATGGEISF